MSEGIKMYNVKGPSKIVAKSRRGITQNNLHAKNIKSTEDELINVPKPIFQNVSKRINNNYYNQEQQIVTPEQEEIVKFINESWDGICSEMDFDSASSQLSTPDSDQSNTSVFYYEDTPTAGLDNFKAFDLESWWGKRLFAFITNSVNATNIKS